MIPARTAPPPLPRLDYRLYEIIEVPEKCPTGFWYAHIRIKEEAVRFFELPELQWDLRSMVLDPTEMWSGYDFSRVREWVCPFALESSETLSLLDVAMISGDVQKARTLHSIGVPQRYGFHLHNICNPWTTIADGRSAQVVMAAYHVCQPLFEDMRRDDALLGCAIAGKQDSIVNLFNDAGITGSAKELVGTFMFRIKSSKSCQHSRLTLQMPCVALAVAAGIDLRSLRVDPVRVLRQAINQCRQTCISWKMQHFFDPPWNRKQPRRLPKWRDNQTLLEMAIRCGQLDATRYLTHALCEATLLTADDLVGPMFHSQVAWQDEPFDVTINQSAKCAEAARLAYHLCRNRHQVLIVQMAGWWSRLERNARTRCTLVVNFANVVNHIATFALAVPPLPEILQLPPPFGTRRAVKRAARRAGLAMRARCTNSAIIALETPESDDKLALDVIQDVVDDSSELPAIICEHEAQASARALWEAAVESAIAVLPTDLSSSKGAGVEEDKFRSNRCESVFLGKLNRIPAGLLKEFAEGPSLRPYRDALVAKGLPWRLDSGVMIFVNPWQHSAVKAALGHRQLHPDHVVFAESLEYLVEEVLQRHKIWIKTRSLLKVCDINPNVKCSSSDGSQCQSEVGSEDGPKPCLGSMELGVACTWGVWAPEYITMKRTFLCLANPDPVEDAAVTVSTTDVRNRDANPRRARLTDL